MSFGYSGGGSGDVTASEFANLQALLATNFRNDIAQIEASAPGLNLQGVLADSYYDTSLVDVTNSTATHDNTDKAYRTTAASTHNFLMQSGSEADSGGDDDGSTTLFLDTIGTHTVTVRGSSKHATDQFFYGTSSFYFPSGSYATVAKSTEFNLGTNVFTMECRFRTTSLASNQGILSIGGGAGDLAVRLDVYTDGSLQGAGTANGTTAVLDFSSASGLVAINTWYHVALTRDTGNVWGIYLNGTRVATTTNSFTVHSPTVGGLNIASSRSDGSTLLFVGHMEEISFLNGTCRYSGADATSAVPSAPYSTALTNYRVPTVAISCGVAPTKCTALIAIESGAPYDTIIVNTDVKAYLTQTGDEDPEDVAFAGNELTLVSKGTVVENGDTLALYGVDGATVTGTSTGANKFVVHGPTGKDFRVHDTTVLLFN